MAAMRQRLSRSLLAILCFFACSAQNPASQEAKGTALVSGRVTRIDTGDPVPNATVWLSSLGGVGIQSTSGANGTFTFTGVAAGDYRLSANTNSLVSADATPAQPLGLGKVFKVSDGQQLNGLDVLVTRMAVIEGRVLDQARAPLADVPVSLVQPRQAANETIMIPILAHGSVNTDSSGKFRFEALLPGEYYLLATAGPFGAANPGQSITVPEKLLPYVPTFFPGTDRMSGARSVRVEVGIDAVDVTFALVPAVPVTMSGMVVDDVGLPVPGASLILIPTEAGAVQADLAAKATSDASGKFMYRGIPSGTYVLQSFVRGWFGSKPVTVPAIKEELTGVNVTVRPRVTARGRFTFDGGPPPAKNLVTANFVPTDFLSGPIGGNALLATLHDDWTFEFSDLAWFGLIRVSAPPGWKLKAVRHHGRDITNAPSDFQSADVDGLELVMTSHLASISGLVTDGNNPAAYAFVVLLPDDGMSLQMSRSRLGAIAAPDGSFKIAGVLAGRYRIVAVPQNTEPLNPIEWLGSLRSISAPLTVAEDESKSMNLKLVRR